MTVVLLNVHRTVNNNVIVHKTENKLPEPKYLATEIGIRIAHSQTSVKTMVTLGNWLQINILFVGQTITDGKLHMQIIPYKYRKYNSFSMQTNSHFIQKRVCATL